MDKFNSIVSKIKKIEIQGAENVAYASVEALEYSINVSKRITLSSFSKEIEEKKKILFSTRPTEPCMRNALNFITHTEAKDISEMKKDMLRKVEQAKKHIQFVEKTISKVGSRMIKDGTRIFTHCHSTTVMEILKKAKDQKKNFEVFNTEARPHYQGRITAKELSSYGINVTHFVDSAARLAIKHSDMVLLGCDAVTTTKAINKIGSEMFAEIAQLHKVPVYICTDSWKFDSKSIFCYDEEIEQRKASEMWKEAPKKVKIMNPIFEKIDFSNINGIISEMGLYKPEMFIEEARVTYPYLFH